MKCPECGDGFLRGAFYPIKLPCPICKGTTELPADIDYRQEEGAALRERRKKHRVTLREAAKIMGIKPSELNMRERGFFKKQ